MDWAGDQLKELNKTHIQFQKVTIEIPQLNFKNSCAEVFKHLSSPSVVLPELDLAKQ